MADFTALYDACVMKTLITFQFELQPHPGDTTRQCLAAVRAEVSDWLRGLFRGAGVHDLHLSFDGVTRTPQPDHELRTDEQDCATHCLTSWEWEFPEPRDPRAVWRFSCLLACDARAVQIALVVGVRWRSFVLRPLDFPLDNRNPLCTLAALRDKLLHGWTCRIEGQPVPTRARPLRKNNVERFVREDLLNPTRVLPVVLLSLDGPLSSKADSLQAIQDQVLGLAQIAALLERPATERFMKLMGPAYTPDQVLRVYWPGLALDGTPQDHPYQDLAALHKNLHDGPLNALLVGFLAPVSAQQHGEGPVIRAARVALEAERGDRRRSDPAAAERLAAELEQARQAQQRLQRESEVSGRHVRVLLDELADLRGQLTALRAALATAPARPDERFDELAAELERAWDENKRLRADWEGARRQLAELETDFRTYLDSSVLFEEAPGAADAPTPAGGRSFATVLDALRAAAGDFADVLVVWEDAERSAEHSSFGAPAKVFQALEAIAEVGRAYFKARSGGPPLGPVDRAFLRRVPFKYTAFESQTTMSLFGGERVFHHRGQSRQMQRHLTLGGGNTNRCLQIYFDFDDATQRVLVGYCGRHLPYTRQRT